MIALLLLLTLWQPGPLAPAPLPSVWWAEGLGARPAVVVEGGAGGLVDCFDDGAGLATLRCTIFAQGDWRRVLADGQVIAERGRIYLPIVRGAP
jgi:hypothetical protein